MERKYSIYKITGPTGRYYIGLTKTKVRERWLCHVKYAKKKAKENKRHPLYDSITKYGEDKFIVDTLMTGLTLDEANLEEIRLIAEIPKELRYNVADGGNNGSIGGLTFWRQLDKDPEARAAFVKKASEARKKAEVRWYDRSAQQLQWQKDNPRRAWEILHRRNRMAIKKRYGENRVVPIELTLKERLLRKFKLNSVKQREVTKIWANRDPKKKKEIGANISASLKKRFVGITEEERLEVKRKADYARSCINRKTQGPAASKGIKAWWDELRKDPVAYRAHIDNRTRTLLKGLKEQGVNIRTTKYEDL